MISKGSKHGIYIKRAGALNRSIWKKHTILIKRSWNLEEESIIPTWKVHKISIKRAWDRDEECMRLTIQDEEIYMFRV